MSKVDYDCVVLLDDWEMDESCMFRDEGEDMCFSLIQTLQNELNEEKFIFKSVNEYSPVGYSTELVVPIDDPDNNKKSL